MQTYIAEIGEIVRSHRRDEEEIQQMSERLSKILQELGGQQLWFRTYPYLDTISKALYYSATLLSGVQTVGEEYLNIFESSGISRIVPILSKRALFVGLHVFSPLLSNHCLQSCERSLLHPSTNTFLGIPIGNNQKARNTFLRIIQWIRSTLLPSLNRIHLALFYLNGSYYNIARRMVGIRLISFSPQTDIQALKVYRFLGYVTIVHSCVSVLLWLLSTWREKKEQTTKGNVERVNGVERIREKDGNETSIPSLFRCPICLDRRPPSCAPCGHLFCWYCIQEHAHSQSDHPRCPHCRMEFHPKQIVPLLNL